jgi:hypothetical protein
MAAVGGATDATCKGWATRGDGQADIKDSLERTLQAHGDTAKKWMARANATDQTA